MLECPRCEELLFGCWYTVEDGIDDDHGYICCSTCVSWMTTKSRTCLPAFSTALSNKKITSSGHWAESFNRTQELAAQFLRPRRHRRRDHVTSAHDVSPSNNHDKQSDATGAQQQESSSDLANSILENLKTQVRQQVMQHGLTSDVVDMIVRDLSVKGVTLA